VGKRQGRGLLFPRQESVKDISQIAGPFFLKGDFFFKTALVEGIYGAFSAELLRFFLFERSFFRKQAMAEKNFLDVSVEPHQVVTSLTAMLFNANVELFTFFSLIGIEAKDDRGFTRELAPFILNFFFFVLVMRFAMQIDRR
jgi:glycerol uptake facilitator-like aquaporin